MSSYRSSAMAMLSKFIIVLAIVANFIATALLSINAYYWYNAGNPLSNWKVWVNIVLAVVHAVFGVFGAIFYFMM